MQRILIWLLGLGILIFGIQRIRIALRTPEESLRVRIQGMADGFGEGHARTALKGIHEDYRDEASGVGRSDLFDAMRYLFFTQKHPETHAWNLDVDISEDSLTIVFSEDGTSAMVTMNPLFYQTDTAGRHLWWNCRATLEFVLEDGNWWCIRTTDVNHVDRPRI
tara:strand:- start:2462 stop:2953 length:492 start_codon:yes stop_codon:yes gene_type:complete